MTIAVGGRPLAAGGHHYATFAQGQSREEVSGQYEMIANRVKKLKRVAALAAGRISK